MNKPQRRELIRHIFKLETLYVPNQQLEEEVNRILERKKKQVKTHIIQKNKDILKDLLLTKERRLKEGKQELERKIEQAQVISRSNERDFILRTRKTSTEKLLRKKIKALAISKEIKNLKIQAFCVLWLQLIQRVLVIDKIKQKIENEKLYKHFIRKYFYRLARMKQVFVETVASECDGVFRLRVLRSCRLQLFQRAKVY